MQQKAICIKDCEHVSNKCDVILTSYYPLLLQGSICGTQASDEESLRVIWHGPVSYDPSDPASAYTHTGTNQNL